MAKPSFKRLLTILVNLAFLVLILAYLIITLRPNPNYSSPQTTNTQEDVNCDGLHQHSQTRQQKCSYVRSHQGCQPGGYIPYLRLFYCNFPPVLGYFSLFLWLVVLFYLLGDTASNYFCRSLLGLSKGFNLSPTVSGVTLLSLGNGAPDVLSSIISFTGNGTADIGLNSILGAALFVSCVVFGTINIVVDKTRVKVNRKSFVTIVVSLLLSVACVLLIVIIRHVGLWGGISFLFLYIVYVLIIFKAFGEESDVDIDGSNGLDTTLPGQIHFSDQVEIGHSNNIGNFSKGFDIMMCILELPLYFPRRATIPVASPDIWSKPYAILAATLGPLAFSFSIHFNKTESRILAYAISGSIGLSSGILVFFTTTMSNPPTKWALHWLLLEGFIMSIAWTYFVARELVSLLVALSLILGIKQSLIGLTVLAWGNSVGDLFADVAMAKKGGPGAVHVAATGCFAGPLFNILVGLGLSLALAAGKAYPHSFLVSAGNSLFLTFGFLALGLSWTLAVLLKGSMRGGKLLGCGLITIYLCFLVLQILINLGVV